MSARPAIPAVPEGRLVNELVSGTHGGDGSRKRAVFHPHAFDGCHLVTLFLQMADIRLLMGQASIAQQFQCRIPTVRLGLEARPRPPG